MSAPVRHRSLVSHWLMFAIALVLLALFTLYDVLRMRERIEKTAQEQLANYSLVVHDDLQRRFEAIDRTLQHLRGRAPLPADELQTLNDALLGVRILTLYDAHGAAVASNRRELIGQRFAHHDDFKALHAAPLPDRLHLTPPFTTVLDAFTISLARPRYHADGSFAGVIIATLDSDDLAGVLRSQHPHPGLRLAVVHEDGTLLQIVPAPPLAMPGRHLGVPGSFVRRHLDSGAPHSLMTGRSDVTGTESMISIRTLKPAHLPLDAGLLVTAARDMADVLAPWHREARLRVMLWLAIALASVAAMAIYQRRQHHFEVELARQTQARQRTLVSLQCFIDHLPGLAYIKDADSRTLMANRGFQTLLGLDPASMIGKTSRELFPGAFGEKLVADDRRVLESARTEVIEERFGGRDYETIRFIIDAGDDTRQIGGITLDITARKEAERQQAEQMARLSWSVSRRSCRT